MGLFDGTALERPVVCEECGQRPEDCVCVPPEPEVTPPADQPLRVRTEKRKYGKQATIVSGVADEPGQLKQHLKALQQLCGTGGAVKDGVIELQGKHAERVIAHLKKAGFPVRT